MAKNIELTWKYVGPCPDQWYAYFYDEHDDKTYCVYIRQDSFSWSADLGSTDGCHNDDEFENLPTEMIKWEEIELSFEYPSVYVTEDKDEMYFNLIVQDAMLYLSHRFTYYHFEPCDSKYYDFIGELAEGDKDSRMEVLSRRAELMRRYLAEYQDFLDNATY